MMEIEDFINTVVNQDFAKAGPMFTELLQAKVDDAMDAEKVKLANQIYNGVEDDQAEFEEDDINLSDEDMGDADEESEEEVEETDEEESK